MMKWKLKEQYEAQQTKFIELNKTHSEKVREAEQKVRDLVAKKAELLRREVSEGKDLSSERLAVSAEIEAAEKAVLEAKELRSVATTYVIEEAQKGISALDLTQDWNRNYIPEVREKELSPILARMNQAKEDMYNALFDFYELLDDYGSLRGEVSDLESREADAQRRPRHHVHEIEMDYNLPIVNVAADLNSIKHNHTLPNGITRKPTNKKEK